MKSIFLWLRRALVVTVIILVPLFLMRWWDLQQATWKGQADLESAIAETTALDPRWRWEQIQEDQPEIPEEQNSLRIVRPLGEKLESLALSKLEQLEGNRFAFANVEPNRLLGAEDREILTRIFTGNEDHLTRALSVKDHPRGQIRIELDPFVIKTPLPHVQKVREIVWLQGKGLERQLDRNRPQEGADTIRAMVNTGNALQGEDMAITQLVRIAIRSISVHAVERLLGMSVLDEATLARLQRLLAQQTQQRPVADGMRGERATMTVMLDNFRSGVVPIYRILDAVGQDGKGATGLWMRWVLWEYSHHLPGEQADMLRWMNRAVEVANQPFELQLARWESLRDEAFAVRREVRGISRGIVTSLTVPAIVMLGESGVRDQTQIRSAEIAIAAERFRLLNQRWPKALDELVPRFLSETSIDPYSGQPYLLRPRPDGLVIYSVGKNGLDDGGERIDSRHFRELESDLGIRLWNPDRRRLPAVAVEGNPMKQDGMN